MSASTGTGGRTRKRLSFFEDAAAVTTWGGKREGAGRKPKARYKRVAHVVRPDHAKRHPVHVTLRAHDYVPSLRDEGVRSLIEEVIEGLQQRGMLDVALYAVRDDHLHLVVEATDKRALSSGLRSFIITSALRLNRLLGNGRGGRLRGKVWADRYARRDLVTPVERARALRFIEGNDARHRPRARRPT